MRRRGERGEGRGMREKGEGEGRGKSFTAESDKVGWEKGMGGMDGIR